MCDLQRFSGLVQPGSVCLNSLGLISTPFSKILGVSEQGKTSPIYLGSHTGGELPTSLLFPNTSSPHRSALVLPGPMASLGLIGRASLAIRDGQQRSRPA